MTESIGSYLRRERELRKISLEEVAEQTRIKIEHLHAIESEHFEKIPGMTFAREATERRRNALRQAFLSAGPEAVTGARRMLSDLTRTRGES